MKSSILSEKILAFLLDSYIHHLLATVEAEALRNHPDFPHDLDDHEFHGLLSVRIGVRSLAAKVAACDENIALIRIRLAKEAIHA